MESPHAPHPHPHAKNDPCLDPRRPENSPPTRSTHPGAQDRPGTQALRIRRPPEGILAGREPPLALTALPHTHIYVSQALALIPVWSIRTILQYLPASNATSASSFAQFASLNSSACSKAISTLAETVNARRDGRPRPETSTAGQTTSQPLDARTCGPCGSALADRHGLGTCDPRVLELSPRTVSRHGQPRARLQGSTCAVSAGTNCSTRGASNRCVSSVGRYRTVG
jgi:hypothetical protein